MKELKCNLCEAIAEKHRTACKQVVYCTKEHQKQDWPNHKLSCSPIKLALDKVKGRYA